MNWKKSIILTGILIILAGILVFIYSSKKDDDFGFILKYGVGGKNVINTFEGTFQKDLIPGTAKTEIKLKKEEMEMILEKMLEIDILNYPGSFEKIVYVTPKEECYLKIKYKNTEKVILWSTDNMPLIVIVGDDLNQLDEKYDKIKSLNQLKMFIIDIIENTKEYKKLPEVKGAYM